MKVRTASRSIGGVAIMERSRTPVSASCSVRGIGVAESVSTWTAARSSFSRSLWRTPKCCSSSTTRSAEVLELDRLAEQRVRADRDVDRAVGDARLDARQLGGADEPRGLPDLERQPAEALGEGGEVLAGEERRRHDDGDLLAVHRRDEGGAERHLRLAEADVAADEPVHRPPGLEVVERRLDRRILVVGLLVGEARRKFVIEPGRGRERRGGARQPRGGGLDQLLRHVADALLEPRLAVLPGDAAEPVEIGLRALRAVAGQKLDVLDRQEQPVVRRRRGFPGSRAARPPPRWF